MILSRAIKTYANCASSGEFVKETSESAVVQVVLPIASELNLIPKAKNVTWYANMKMVKHGSVQRPCSKFCKNALM